MLGEELECMHETGNVQGLYAVGVVRTGTGTTEPLHWPPLYMTLALPVIMSHLALAKKPGDFSLFLDTISLKN